MPAKLLFRDAQGRDAAVDLPEAGAYLGRAVECIVRTDDAMVSRRNTKISFLGGRWYVEDQSSTYGTFINERRIQREVLNHGDVIRCGSLQVRFIEVAELAQSVQPVQSVAHTPADLLQVSKDPGTSARPSSGSDDDTSAAGLAPYSVCVGLKPSDGSDDNTSAARAMSEGWLGIDAPRVMAMGDTALVRVIAVTSLLHKALVEEALLQENQQLIQKRFAPLVRMDLVAVHPSDFAIRRLSPSEQLVDSDELTVWEWLITAQGSGEERLLLLTISNLIRRPEGQRIKALPARHISIWVRVQNRKIEPVFSTATLRKLLDQALVLDADLNAFCLDYFRSIYVQFSGSMERTTKLNLLLQYGAAADITRALREGYPELVAKLTAEDLKKHLARLGDLDPASAAVVAPSSAAQALAPNTPSLDHGIVLEATVVPNTEAAFPCADIVLRPQHSR